MPRNIEIKARIYDPQGVMDRARMLAGSEPVTLLQDDTFFNCPEGRLKLRMLSDAHGELIFYQRPNTTEPCQSEYAILPTDQPRLMREVLERALGTCGRVLKRRQVFLVGRTRIHVDEVERLGTFLELEVVMADDEHLADGVAEARRIMQELHIRDDQLVDAAYVDLLGAIEERVVR